MRKILAIMLSCILVFSMTGCSSESSKYSGEGTKENKYVKLVKETKNKYYSDLTYGDAFKYFFSNPKWEFFKGERVLETTESGATKTKEKCDIVEFTGGCTFNDKEVKVVLQFDIDRSKNTFEPSALKFDGEERDMILIDGLIGKAFQEYENEQKSLTKKAGSKDKVDLQSLADCIMSFSDPPTGAMDNFEEYYTKQYNIWKNKEGYYSIIQNEDGTFKHIDYNEAYSDILKEYEEGDDDYYSASYGLYDIDHNGTYELIISYGTTEADWSNAVYEYTDSGVKYIDEIGGSVGLYGAENRNGIYAVSGKMGSETIRRITLDNENLTDEIILEEDVGEGDYYSNDDPIEMTDIYDHSAIESMD